MPQDSETDLRLLEELKHGRDSALNEIIDRWEKPLTSFAWRYVQNTLDAQDLVQETFVRVYKYKDRFRENTRLSAWLFTTLSNLCKNFGRWKRRHPTVSLLSANEDYDSGSEGSIHMDPADPGDSPFVIAGRSDMIDHLKIAIQKLPHDLKTTLILYQYEGHTYKEIAEIVDCSTKGVETRLYRTKKLLKGIMMKEIREVDSA